MTRNGIHCVFLGVLACSQVLVSELVVGEVSSDPQAISLTTGKFVIPPGESHECFYLMTTDRELNMVAEEGHQDPGGHHFTLAYTDLPPREPGHHPCTEEDVSSFHTITGLSGYVRTTRFELPEALAVKIPAGKQLVLQSHYINPSGSTMTVEDTLTVYLSDHVSGYVQRAGPHNERFEIPPHRSAQSSTTCTLSRNLRIIRLGGHMHQLGSHFRLETVDATGKPLTTLYEEDWQPSYTWAPPIRQYPIEAPLELAAGTRLHYTCEWYNPTDSLVRFPMEMCAAPMMYLTDGGLPVPVAELFLCQADAP